jgi:ParB/RepB/Spo0J family partition protein
MTIQTIKLAQILPDPVTNSRHHSASETGLKELADNIQAIGLILPLAVRPVGDGLYRILDGHRRHQALTMIHSGKLEETDVPVLVRDADNADARVLSLAANIMRLPLHPADQYEAFAAMLDEGIDRQAIATRFALPLKDVDQRLALGKVTQPFLTAYRQDQLTVETIMYLSALSISRQWKVLKLIDEQGGLDSKGVDWKIRNLINDKAVFSNNAVVKFAGLNAYEMLGGRVERSLFDDTERLINTDLLYKIAEEKVPQWIEAMRADGWMFAVREQDMPKKWEKWERHYAAPIYSEDQTVRLAVLEQQLEDLHDIDGENWTDELEEETDTLEEEAREIRRSSTMSFTAEEKSESVAVLHDDWRVTYGYIWPKAQAAPEEGAKPAAPEVKGWSQKLVDDIESHGTVAAQLAVMREKTLADDMLLAGLYQDTIAANVTRVLALNSTDRFADTEINAGRDITSALKGFGLKGHGFWSLVDQISKLTPEDRDELRALLVARILKKRRGKDLDEMFEHTATANVLASFKPEKEFFERLTTAQLEEIHKELTGKGFNTPTTKQSAVAMVVTQASARNWLPKSLRKGMTPLDKAKLDHDVESAAKMKPSKKGVPVTTIVGEDGKTEKKRAA